METGAPAVTQPQNAGLDAIPVLEARETSGITSKLVLAYVEREGGREAIEEVLGRCGLEGREEEMRDEGHWFPFATKIALFEAAADVLDDPQVMRRVGETALELGVADGLKAALRALGSPALLYKNVVRANAKFNTVQGMELLELHRTRARIRFFAMADVPFHSLDCDYNVGLLSCAPEIFGLPRARVSHPACAAGGEAEACVYDLSWESHSSSGRAMAGAVGAGALAIGGTAVLAPALVPAGIAAAGLAAATAAWHVRSRTGTRRRQLEHALAEQSRLADRLAASLQDLVGELRLDELLEKITEHAQAAVRGKEFALLVENEDGTVACRSSSGLPPATIRALELWFGGRSGPPFESEVIDDMRLVPTLEHVVQQESMPLSSLCCAPLVYRGRVLGALVALAAAPHSFLPKDIDLLRSYAVQVAIALANARMFEAQERLAARDPLTGLLNRREFDAALTREIERCRRHGGAWSLVLLDLDGFKHINDAKGHSAGDRALREAANALSAACRASDLAFRIGGDEFALLLPETSDKADATTGAERACDGLAAGALGLSASYGVAVWPSDGLHKDTVMNVADRRLYDMKGSRTRVEAPTDTAADVLAVLADTLEASDPHTAEHTRVVAELSEGVARRLGLSGARLQALHHAALLHDIGKIAVPNEILSKPTRLTDEEVEQVKRHSIVGPRILERVPYLRPSLPLIRSVHERWDGCGYPDGLSGDEIPLGARIIAVADAFHAMTSDRPYRRALPRDEALAELRRCAGTQFDPDAVQALLHVLGATDGHC
jgi:diguanylate cyclase (GGDEF)-like protein/putative nucleotidyltransferase with HDIG domain